MKYIMYTEKSVSECMKELNARLQAKRKPELGGWVEKGGDFALTCEARVLLRFKRKSRITGTVEREKGTTTITGFVAYGVSPGWMLILTVLLLGIVGALFLVEQMMLGLLLLAFAVVSYVPLRGDYVNSFDLLDVVRRTLKASYDPPKKSTKATD